MNDSDRLAETDDDRIRRSGTGGPIPAEDLDEQELREADDLGDGSPAVEPRRDEKQRTGQK